MSTTTTKAKKASTTTNTIPAAEPAEQPVERVVKGELSLPAFITLAFLCLMEKPQNIMTDEDRSFLENNNIVPSPEIVQELEEMKVVTVKEETKNGVITTALNITKYGEKWVLQSLRFGPQFNILFKSLSKDAKFRAFFQLVDNIHENQGDQVIFKNSTTTKKPSEIYKGFRRAIETIESWLES